MIRTLTCIDCRTDFSYDYVRGAVRQRCEPCRDANRRETNRQKQEKWREANPDRAREQWNRYNRKRLADPAFLAEKREREMVRSYGMTMAEFDELLSTQGGVCAICAGERNGPGTRLHVDHCHTSGKVRGLLCGKCNTAVGLLDDNPERAERLAQYLRK